MTHVFSGKYGVRKLPNSSFCVAAVPDGGRSVGFHQCTNKPRINRMVDWRDGQKEFGFCGLHDPVAVKQKDDARREVWKQKFAKTNMQNELHAADVVAMDACKVAIEKIAAGHNDARGLAQETLKLFPKTK